MVPRRLIRPFEACRAKTHFQGSSACGFAGYTFSVDDALKALAALDERKGKVVELKFFGGLSMEEIAEVLRVSTDTVKRDWKVARLWLLQELAWRTEWNQDFGSEWKRLRKESDGSAGVRAGREPRRGISWKAPAAGMKRCAGK